MKRPIRIIHLEDLESDAGLVERALGKSELKYDKIWVTNRAEYENALEKFSPDIILSDHYLPSLTSYDALKMLKERGMNMPFILVTATISEEYVVKMIGEGINDYILKDRLQRLPNAIMNALEKAQAEKDKERYYYEIVKQEKRFRALIENISEAILVIDKDGKITYQTPSAKRVSGYSNEDAINQSIFTFFGSDDIRGAKQLFEAAFARPGIPLHQSYKIKHKDGHFIWVEGTITNLLHDESVNGFIINYRDVTERKIAEELLKKSEANLSTIYNNTTIGYVLLNKNLEIISFNQSAFSIYKSEGKSELKEGVNFLECIAENRKTGILNNYTETLKGEKVIYDIFYDRANGSVNWYNKNFLPIFDENKNVLGVIISIEDITDRKMAELEKEKMTADLIQHNKNLEQFAYIISHNLRSPVANIIGLSNMIQSYEGMSKADFTRCMDGLVLSVKRLDEIIIDLNHILQVRRAIDEKKQNVRFSAIVKDVKTSISNLIAKENITIKTDFIKANEIFTIKSYVNSIFYNLISNSIKYRDLERPAIIEIRSKRVDDKIMLIFKDNGLGIDMSLNENKIFGLYKKFHNHIEGKGMGLYMVKTQVEILGGKISIASEVGHGTEFTIEFE